MEDIECKQNDLTILYENNDGAKAQTENSLHYKQIKHVNIVYHYIRQIISGNVVILVRINSANQVADLITKSLSKTPFEKLHTMLRLKTTKLVTSVNV